MKNHQDELVIRTDYGICLYGLRNDPKKNNSTARGQHKRKTNTPTKYTQDTQHAYIIK
jgi:hypothetical protein